MRSTFAAAVLFVAVLSGCASDPVKPAPTLPPNFFASPSAVVASNGVTVGNPCSPRIDRGCGSPDAGCATNRLGRQFVRDGVVYTCSTPEPYAWRRD
jgi:hypothetical protein